MAVAHRRRGDGARPVAVQGVFRKAEGLLREFHGARGGALPQRQKRVRVRVMGMSSCARPGTRRGANT